METCQVGLGYGLCDPNVPLVTLTCDNLMTWQMGREAIGLLQNYWWSQRCLSELYKMSSLDYPFLLEGSPHNKLIIWFPATETLSGRQ